MARKKAKLSNKAIIIITVLVIVILVALITYLAVTDQLDDVIDMLSSSFGGNDTDDTVKGDFFGTIDGDVLVKVHFVNVGQGDAIVIELPEDKYMVIDAGSGTRVDSETKDAYYNYLDSVIDGDKIDYLVATHPDSDHVNMLSGVLERYDVGKIYYNDYDKASGTYQTFMDNAEKETDDRVVISTTNDSYYDLQVGECSLRFYSAGNDGFPQEGTQANEMSIMCLLTYGGRKLLLTGDATDGTEEWFIDYTARENMNVDFLKVGHHGSAGSSSNAFLDYIDAEYGIICVDENDNGYGHPTEAALSRLNAHNVKLYRTDLNGNVILTLDSDGDYQFAYDKAS